MEDYEERCWKMSKKKNEKRKANEWAGYNLLGTGGSVYG